MLVSPYAKAIVAAILPVVVLAAEAVQAVSGDGLITAADWAVIFLSVLSPYAVYRVPNERVGRHAVRE